jgi:hypothetical protein
MHNNAMRTVLLLDYAASHIIFVHVEGIISGPPSDPWGGLPGKSMVIFPTETTIRGNNEYRGF